MIYQILIGIVILIAVLLVIYFFFPLSQKGIPKEPAKRPTQKSTPKSAPYYSEGEVIVDDELYGMKMIWDAYEDRVENFIKYLETSASVKDPKIISTFQDLEGEYVKVKERLRPFLRDHMMKRMDERILHARDLINKKFRY